jgi:alpha-beta hydrolase superfamily lysophospholipase
VKRTPVVLIHGAWFHASSWEGWARRFTAHGYAVYIPSWPGEADTVARMRRDPGPLQDLGLDALSAHYEKAVRALEQPPVLIGHSAGGLIAQQLLGAGLGRAAVAIAPLPVAGLTLDETRLRLWSPNLGGSGESQDFVQLSRHQFRHTVANTVGEEESGKLFERYVIPAPRRLLGDLGLDGAEAPVGSVDTDNTARGPLLLISGQEDRMVADAMTRAMYKLYGDSTAMTDLKQFADRGHSLAIDSGWPVVADYVMVWLAANGFGAAAAEG